MAKPPRRRAFELESPQVRIRRLREPTTSEIVGPYMPSQDEVKAARAAAQEDAESDYGIGKFLSDIFSVPDRLLGGQSLKALIAGDVGAAVANNPLSQALAIFTPLTREDLGIEKYDMRRIRESWGDTSAQTGALNFALNFVGDFVFDPGSFLMPFGKLSAIGKATGNPAAINMARGLLSQAVENGTRAMLVFKVPLIKNTGFVVPWFKSFEPSIARGLEGLSNFLNTNAVTAGVLKVFDPAAAGLGDVKDAAGKVVVSGSAQRDFVRKALRGRQDAITAYKENYLPVLRQKLESPAGALLLKDKDAQAVVYAASELGMSLTDDMAAIRSTIESGLPYARGKAARNRLLNENADAVLLADRMRKGDAKAVSEWMEQFPGATLPAEGLPLAQSMGAARPHIDLGIDTRVLGHESVDQSVRRTIMPAGGVGVAERGAIADDVGSVTGSALVEAKSQMISLFEKFHSGKGSMPLADLMEIAEAGRTLMERVGHGDVMKGILNGMLDNYAPRILNPEVAEMVEKQWLSGVRSVAGEKADAVGAFFQKHRKFSDLAKFEVEYVVREIGTKYLGYTPLADLGGTAGQNVFWQTMAKIFPQDFIDGLRKVRGGEDIAEFFASNPGYAWNQRIARGAQVSADADFYGTIFAKDSPLVLNRDMVQDLTEETIQYRASRNLRGFLVDAAKPGTAGKPVAYNNLFSTLVDDESRAAVQIARDDLRAYVDDAIVTKKANDAQIIDSLTSDRRAFDLADADLAKFTPWSPAGAVIVKNAKDVRHEQNLVKGLQLEADALAGNRVDMRGLRDAAKSELSTFKQAKTALEDRLRVLDRHIAASKKAAAETKFTGPQAEIMAKEAAESRAGITKARQETWQAIQDHDERIAELQRDLTDAKSNALLVERAKKRVGQDIAERNKEIARLKASVARQRAAIDNEIGTIREQRDAFIKMVKEDSKASRKELTSILNEKLERGRMADEIAIMRMKREGGALAIDELMQRRPDLWQKIKERHGTLAVHWMDAGVAERMLGKDGLMARLAKPYAPSDAMKMFDSATWWWKAWTTMNPAFINTRVRDVITTGVTSMMFGGSPRVFKEMGAGSLDAWKMMLSLKKHLRGEATDITTKVITRGDGATINIGDLMSEVQRRGVANSSLVGDALRFTGEEEAIRAGIPGGTWSKVLHAFDPRVKSNTLINYGFRMAEGGDNLAKIATVIANWRAGKSVDEAIDFVKGVAYNPNDVMLLTTLERHHLRRWIPMYSFAKYALTKTMSAAALRPGSIGALDKLIRNARSFTGLTPEESDLVMPEFVRDNLGIPFRVGADGEVEYALFGSFHPAGTLVSLANALRDTGDKEKGGLGEWIGQQMNPMLRIPLEFAIGRSFYGQREIERFDDEATEFMGVSMSKKSAHVLRSIRFLNEVDRLGIFSSEDLRALRRAPGSEWKRVLSSAFGVVPARIGEVDAVRQLEFAQIDNAREITKAKAELRRQIESGSGRATEKNVETLKQLLARRIAKSEAIIELKGN